MAPRFLPLAEVAEALSISAVQAYALVRSGELPAIQVGGRGQWRVEHQALEDFIQAKYAETRARVAGRPADEGAVDAGPSDGTRPGDVRSGAGWSAGGGGPSPAHGRPRG